MKILLDEKFCLLLPKLLHLRLKVTNWLCFLTKTSPNITRRIHWLAKISDVLILYKFLSEIKDVQNCVRTLKGSEIFRDFIVVLRYFSNPFVVLGWKFCLFTSYFLLVTLPNVQSQVILVEIRWKEVQRNFIFSIASAKCSQNCQNEEKSRWNLANILPKYSEIVLNIDFFVWN